MSRVADKIAMIARRATKVVAETTMPRSATPRARDFVATRMGTGFAGGLLRCASCEGHQPFAASHALHPIPQNRVRSHAGLILCFPNNRYRTMDNSDKQPMTTKQIIFVPGKNPKPEEAPHRELLWRTLVEGVRRADAVVAGALQSSYPQFHLVGWNYLYYHVHTDITKDIPWIDALINKHGPTEQDIQDANSWNIWLARFLLTIGDDIPLLIRLLPEAVRSTANEIGRYFSNTDNAAGEVRGLLKQILRPMLEKQDSVLLIGHSLGSVIAYDALWELSRMEEVKGKADFLTLGSPMGMHYINRRLLGMDGQGGRSYPDRICRWINLSAEGDVVALNRNFNEVFHPMLELGLVESIEDHSHGIYNFFRSNEGLNSHRSYGYLVNPAVGSIIADWWKHH
jgi:hypothetical protein